MDRGKLSLVVVGVAVVVIWAAVHFSKGAPVSEPGGMGEAAPRRAPAAFGRGTSSDEEDVEAVGETRHAARAAARPVGVGKGSERATQNSVVGKSAMAESARGAQTMSVGGARRGGGVVAGNAARGGTSVGGAGQAVSETGIAPGEAARRTLPGSQAGRPGNVPGSDQAPSEQQVAEPGTTPPAAGQNAPSDIVLSVPLKGTTQPEDPNQPQPVAEQNIKPNDNGNGIEFPGNSVLEFPDAATYINPQGGTISLDIQPTWDASAGGSDSNSFVAVKTPEMWAADMMLYRNGPYLRFSWMDTNQQEQNVGVNISDWAPGEQHSVTATWGEALMSVYIDGQLAGQQTYSGDLAMPPGLPMFLGSNPQNHVPGADATLQNFKVYNRPLTPDEVAAQLANQNG